MARPIQCAECGDTIGTEDEASAIARIESVGIGGKLTREVECPGKGKDHPSID